MDLIGRTFASHDAAASHRGGSAAVSIALHCTVLLALIAAFRAAPKDAVTNAVLAAVPPVLVWIPQADAGGGRFGAGDPAVQPPRRAQVTGRDSASAPAPAEVSPQITNNAPEDVPSIPARPMGDSLTALAGAIDGQSASTALGAGNTQGAGSDKPGNGFFGEGAARGAGVTTPTLILQVKPRYTADAMRMRIQGTVIVECVVLPDGTVGDARIMRSLDARFGLDEEALVAAKQWRFRPGTLNGKPVPVVVSIELMFSVR
jgi:protein TonB